MHSFRRQTMALSVLVVLVYRSGVERGTEGFCPSVVHIVWWVNGVVVVN